MARFRNASGFDLTIDRFGLYVEQGAEFELDDVDAASLDASPFFARLDAAEPEETPGEPEQTPGGPEQSPAALEEAPVVVEDAPVVPVVEPAPVEDLDSFTQA